MAEQNRDASARGAGQGGDREVRREAQAEPGTAGGETRGSVTTMVCVTCGNEEFFDDRVPDNLKCRKCGSVVFRTFETPAPDDEVAASQLEEQARSMAYGDASPETSPDEVRDLDVR
jgi:hypothetical protein